MWELRGREGGPSQLGKYAVTRRREAAAVVSSFTSMGARPPVQ